MCNHGGSSDLCELPNHEQGGELVLGEPEIPAGGWGRASGGLGLPLSLHAGCADQLAIPWQHTLLQRACTETWPLHWCRLDNQEMADDMHDKVSQLMT